MRGVRQKVVVVVRTEDSDLFGPDEEEEEVEKEKVGSDGLDKKYGGVRVHRDVR